MQRDERRTCAVERREGTWAPRGRNAPSEGLGSLSAEKRQWAAGNLHLGSDCTKKDIFKNIFRGFFLKTQCWIQQDRESQVRGRQIVKWEKQMQVLDNPGSYWYLSFQYQRKSIKCNKTREMISNTSNSNTIRHNQSVNQYSQSQRRSPWLKRQLCSPRSERPLLFCARRQAEDAAPSVGQTSAERPFVSWRSCSSLLRTQIQKKYWKKKTSTDTLLSGRLK